jgi:perosamine synthetase
VRTATLARLAIAGGTPVRSRLLPYGRQTIDDSDVKAVANTLTSDYLTTGPAVDRCERAFASAAGVADAVALSNGTAALHAMMDACGIGPGDEVIVPPMTFVATANAVVFQGATPVFVDVDPDTLLIDPARVAAAVTSRTKAVVAVDYAGQPADYEALEHVANPNGLTVLADACHAIGASDQGRPVGSLAAATTFSLHPVKAVTAGEGGILTTDNRVVAERARRFRSHGIDVDHRRRETMGTWRYEMVGLGFNYRLTDIQCALATSQLAKLPAWIDRRQSIAARYDAAFTTSDLVRPLAVRPEVSHAWHLYVIRLNRAGLTVGRDEIFAALRAEGIGVNVHYLPVHLHAFYRERFGTGAGMCPRAEEAYERMLTLPLFPAMGDRDVADVIEAVAKVTEAYRA